MSLCLFQAFTTPDSTIEKYASPNPLYPGSGDDKTDLPVLPPAQQMLELEN